MERFTQNARAEPSGVTPTRPDDADWIAGATLSTRASRGSCPRPLAAFPIVDRSLRSSCAGDRPRYGGRALLGLRDDMWSVRSGASPWAGEAFRLS